MGIKKPGQLLNFEVSPTRQGRLKELGIKIKRRKPINFSKSIHTMPPTVPLGKVLVGRKAEFVLQHGQPYTQEHLEKGRFWNTSSGKDFIVEARKVFCMRTGNQTNFYGAGSRITLENIPQGELLDVIGNEIPEGAMHLAYEARTGSLVATSYLFTLSAFEYGRGKVVSFKDIEAHVSSIEP